MDSFILLILIITVCVLHVLSWYQPKIEVVALVKHYKVYLWYNKYDGAEYKGRIYKYLFKI